MSDDKELDIESKADDVKDPIEKAIDDAVVESVKQKLAPVKSSNGNSFFSVFTSLISIAALVAIGVVGYFGYMQFEKMSERLVSLEQSEKNSQLHARQSATTLHDNFTQLQAKVQQVLGQQKTSNGLKLKEMSDHLAATRRQIQDVGGRHRSDWLLAEADYLVRIASNRLLLEKDHVTALVLLVSADERIMQMDDPSLQPIREALSRDMATLRLVKRADIAGLAIHISSLIPQLKALPVLAFQLPEEMVENVGQTDSADVTDWQQSLKNTFKELSVKWFEVRDHGRPITPLMAPETETVLLTNMVLLLQTTQFATLRQHSELYHHSLTQLKNLVSEYFDTSDAIVIAFLNEIDLLNATSVSVDLPKTLESRLMLARQLEKQLQLPVENLKTLGEQ
ncbi:MAG: hypothetical protein GY829_01740 [Gammaproteobacteria bacterium]|nr:hypothetical protein [Gammaproteobacteria bacterium]